ncbi:MAG: hypothetical protein LBT50_02200 [Prevotellaceae bacterium]|jgi:hypothetical protein|nr:hypothetical protein [Prevotellaceae bacterium]
MNTASVIATEGKQSRSRWFVAHPGLLHCVRNDGQPASNGQACERTTPNYEISPFGRNDGMHNKLGKQKRRSRFCFPNFPFNNAAVIPTEGRNLFPWSSTLNNPEQTKRCSGLSTFNIQYSTTHNSFNNCWQKSVNCFISPSG